MSHGLDESAFQAFAIPLSFVKVTKMRTKLFVVAAIVAASSLFFDATEAQAQGRRGCYQGYSNYGQGMQNYGYSASRLPVYSNQMYGGNYYAPRTGYSMGYGNYGNYGNYGGYGYPGNSYLGNSYRSGYGYPARGGLSFGFGTGGFGNQGFGGYRGFGF